MRIRFRHCAAALLFVSGLLAQRGSSGPETQNPPLYPDTRQQDMRLPNGKLQRDEILKAEHQQNLKDAAQLVDLAEQLQQEIEKNDRFVLPLATLKKADDIEKLAHKIRSRLRH